MKNLRRLILFVPPLVLGLYLLMFYFVGVCTIYDFRCRVLVPLLFIALPVSLITSILIFCRTAKMRKLIWIIFYASFLIPLFLFILPNVINQEQKMEYLQGYIPSACEKGGPLVPWGVPFNSKECYTVLRMCEKIDDERGRRACEQNVPEFMLDTLDEIGP